MRPCLLLFALLLCPLPSAATEALANRALAEAGLSMTYSLDSIECAQPEAASQSPFFEQFGTGRRRTGDVRVSAIALDADGHLISVALDGDCTRYRVRRRDGTTFEAELVAWDETSSVGVLRSDEATVAPSLGDPAELRPGDPVWVFGTAYDMPGTIGHGVISSTRRYLPNQYESHYIQTDAPTHRGQSGGPVLDGSGRVVALNAYVLVRGGRSSFDGLAFALPIDVALRIADDLLEHGAYLPARIGVDLGGRTREADVDAAEDAPDDASLAMEEEAEDDGTTVTRADPDGPSRGLLEVGDRIVAIDGRAIASGQDLIVSVRLHRPGDAIPLRIERAGEIIDVVIFAGAP